MPWRAIFITMAAWLLAALILNATHDQVIVEASPSGILAQATKGKAQSTSNGNLRLVGTYVGAPSCGGGARCHAHTMENAPEWNRAHTLWFQQRADTPSDPHRFAYEHLYAFKPDSPGYKIAARISENHVASPEAYRELLAARCNACHATPEPGAATTSSFVNGVSCESCHGAAGGWKNSHRLWTAETTNEEKQKTGFIPLDDVAVRAQLCASCHVGSPDQATVNHELIAAGHPRLYFDFRAFFEALPEHWNRAQDERDVTKRSQRPFQLTVWQAGRLAELSASIAVLEAEAKRATKDDKNWPEFAVYSCYACHHELGSGGFRQQLDRMAHEPGRLDWAASHWGFAELLPDVLQQSLARLTAEMNSQAPNAAHVAELCAAIAEQLDTIQAAQVAIEPPALQKMLAGEQHELMDWDRAKRWWSAWIAATSGSGNKTAVAEQLEASYFRWSSARGPMKDPEYGFAIRRKDIAGVDQLFQSPLHFDAEQFEAHRQEMIRAIQPD